MSAGASSTRIWPPDVVDIPPGVPPERGFGPSRPPNRPRTRAADNDIGMLVSGGHLSGGARTDQCQTERACYRERPVRPLHGAPFLTWENAETEAALLQELHIDAFIKSRARRSVDIYHTIYCFP